MENKMMNEKNVEMVELNENELDMVSGGTDADQFRSPRSDDRVRVRKDNRKEEKKAVRRRDY